MELRDRAEESQVREVYVVAQDADGRELGQSARVPVWIPRSRDLAISRRVAPGSSVELGSTAERRRESRLRGAGECGERRCRAGFEYLPERADTCSESIWQSLAEANS